MAELPTGTVTFLFTDIEGSTDGPGGVRGSYHRLVRVEDDKDVLFLRGEVTCLAVVGNTATISADIVRDMIRHKVPQGS